MTNSLQLHRWVSANGDDWRCTACGAQSAISQADAGGDQSYRRGECPVAVIESVHPIFAGTHIARRVLRALVDAGYDADLRTRRNR